MGEEIQDTVAPEVAGRQRNAMNDEQRDFGARRTSVAIRGHDLPGECRHPVRVDREAAHVAT
jgi:hypothetical protein